MESAITTLNTNLMLNRTEAEIADAIKHLLSYCVAVQHVWCVNYFRAPCMRAYTIFTLA